MNKYELGVVIRADLDDETFQTEMSRVKGFVERFEGNIIKVDEWGRRKLAYPIAKQTEGVYTFITFESPPGAPKEIESRLRITENVLRFMCVRKDEVEVSVAPPKEAPQKREARVEKVEKAEKSEELGEPAVEPTVEPVVESTVATAEEPAEEPVQE